MQIVCYSTPIPELEPPDPTPQRGLVDRMSRGGERNPLEAQLLTPNPTSKLTDVYSIILIS
jgi:hypothetical protein